MRIERLTLDRYGHFEGRAFDFSGEDVRLHVVFGPNEAGKSTLLSAVGDLLFQFPHRTDYDFRWPASELLLSATVSDGANERLSFRRRKGRDKTLQNEAGAPIPEEKLSRFLGSADRELFERMFGLDQARLRKGGEAMLAAGGDLTRSLFEAGSGLTRVVEARDRIEKQISELGALGGRAAPTKPLWKEIRRFNDSQQQMRSDGLRGDEWRAAEQALGDAVEARRRLTDEAAVLRRRRSRLERIRRVAPILLAIDQREQRLAALSPLAARLPEGFDAEWRAADEECRTAGQDHRHEQDALAALVRQASEAPAPLGFEARREEITGLYETLGEFLKDRQDEPKLVQALAADDRVVADHLTRLGLPADFGTVEARMPSDVLIARVRALAGEGKDLRTRRDALDSERRKARDRVGEEEEALRALPLVAADPAAAAADLAEALTLGDAEDRLAQAARDDAAAERDLQEALARLSPWKGRAEDLAACPVPARDLVTRFAQRLRRIEEERESAERRHREAGDGLNTNAAEREGLGELGEIPSPAAVSAARDRRDRAWRLIRARLGGGATDPADLLDVAPGANLPATFETFLRHADELVDRREAESYRLQRLADLSAQRRVLLVQQDAAVLAREEAGAAWLETQSEWIGAWSGLLAAPRSPETMLEWLHDRDEVLRLLTDRRRAAEALALARQAVATVREHLAHAARRLDVAMRVDEPTATLLHRVRRALAEAQSDWSDRALRAAALEDARRSLSRLDSEVADTEAALDGWQGVWAEAVSQLHLRPDASLAEAEEALSHWQSIRERWANRAQIRSRLDGLRRDVEQFRTRLGDLLSDLGPISADLGPGEPGPATRALHERLQGDLLRIDRAAELSARIVDTRQRAEALGARLSAARDRAQALLRTHGLCDGIDPFAVATEAREWRTLWSEIATERSRLLAAGDGLDEPALREEAASVPPDDRAAALATLEEEAVRLDAAGQEAAQAETAARERLRTLEGKSGASDAAQEMRHAGNAIAALSERWMRLEAARHLLDRAMERYRAENEHPLLRRASELFGLLATGGEPSWDRLEVRHGQGDAPELVALRTDGATCKVGGLSEGTRDQLFLALRIAALERHVGDHAALPFLADDLFVTSDDRRLVPGLAALSELGRSVQVLLFTHHAHVLDAALSTLPAGTVRAHRL